jgi:hypothetical protein
VASFIARPGIEDDAALAADRRVGPLEAPKRGYLSTGRIGRRLRSGCAITVQLGARVRATSPAVTRCAQYHLGSRRDRTGPAWLGARALEEPSARTTTAPEPTSALRAPERFQSFALFLAMGCQLSQVSTAAVALDSGRIRAPPYTDLTLFRAIRATVERIRAGRGFRPASANPGLSPARLGHWRYAIARSTGTAVSLFLPRSPTTRITSLRIGAGSGSAMAAAVRARPD